MHFSVENKMECIKDADTHKNISGSEQQQKPRDTIYETQTTHQDETASSQRIRSLFQYGDLHFWFLQAFGHTSVPVSGS